MSSRQFSKIRRSSTGRCSLGALNCPWLSDWFADLFALWIFPPYLMWFVTRSQTWRGWWRVSRIMQQPCSNHILCSQVLPLVLMPQDSRTTITSGRKSTPSLSVTRYLEEEMMSNSQLMCLESIFLVLTEGSSSWYQSPPFSKFSLLLFLLRQGPPIDSVHCVQTTYRVSLCPGTHLGLCSSCWRLSSSWTPVDLTEISAFCRDLFSHLRGSKFLFSRGKWK